VFSIGQSVRPRLGTTSSRPAFFQICPATHCQGLRPNCPQGGMARAALPSPVVLVSPPQSPYSLVFKVTRDHSLFSCYFCDLSFYTLGLDLLQTYCFLCFWCPPLSLVFLCRNPVWIDELEMEIQLSGYHRCLGCSITMVKGERLSLQQVPVHGKISIIMGMDFVLHCYPHGLSYFRYIFHLGQS